MIPLTARAADFPVTTAFPSNISRGTDSARCGAVVTWTAPTATDNCAGAVALSCNHNPGDTFPVGTTTVTCTATDGANSSTCTFTVTVSDDDAPVISGCPGNISQGTDSAGCGAVVVCAAQTATDKCAGAVALSCNHNPGDTFPVGTTTVTCTATDGANSSTCT